VAYEDAMSLKDKVREKFEAAKRAGNREEKNLLSVILGDIATAEARSDQELPEAEVEKLLRKLVESNTETRAAALPPPPRLLPGRGI
jgi:hypothetical protein